MARILLVEDSDVCALVFRRALEKAGFAVVVATTISDALHMAATQVFDAALVDTQLPDGDGSTIPLTCPRIMMSADSAPGVIAKSSGAAPLVDAVRHVIADPLNQAQAQAQAQAR